MRKLTLPYLAGFALSLCAPIYASCVPLEVEEEQPSETETASVRVVTRAASASDNVYPLRIYAFAENGSLRSSLVVESADEMVNLRLPQGEETRVVAISADDAVYNLPESPTATSLITTKSPQLPEGISASAQKVAKGFVSSNPLQMAFADITPTASSVTLNLQMHYQMSSLRFSLSGLSPECLSAYVSVSSPFESITLGGVHTGSQKSAIPLVQDDEESSIWQSGEVYLFPTSGTQTNFTIAYNDAEGEQFAQVTYLSCLRAGTPYVLNGALLDGMMIVEGSVTPAQWGSPESITFTFSPDFPTTVDGKSDGSAGNPDETVYWVNDIPESLSLWEGHVVVGMSPVDETSAYLSLVSVSDFGGLTSANSATSPQMAADLARDYQEYGLGAWSIPTADEARMLRELYLSDTEDFDALLEEANADPIVLTDEKGNNIRYLCEEGLKTYSFKPGSSYDSIKEAGASVKNYRLRLLTSVYVKQKNK